MTDREGFGEPVRQYLGRLELDKRRLIRRSSTRRGQLGSVGEICAGCGSVTSKRAPGPEPDAQVLVRNIASFATINCRVL